MYEANVIHCSTALLVDATLCSLGVLVRVRPSIAPKIVSAVLNFNPFRHTDLPVTLRQKLEIRSMERTAKCFSTSILKMPKLVPFPFETQAYALC